jgi:hypothetical protein
VSFAFQFATNLLVFVTADLTPGMQYSENLERLGRVTVRSSVSAITTLLLWLKEPDHRDDETNEQE